MVLKRGTWDLCHMMWVWPEPLSLWKQLLASVKERDLFQDLQLQQSPWKTMEQGIQHLWEVAMIEILFSNDDQTSKSTDLPIGLDVLPRPVGKDETGKAYSYDCLARDSENIKAVSEIEMKASFEMSPKTIFTSLEMISQIIIKGRAKLLSITGCGGFKWIPAKNVKPYHASKTADTPTPASDPASGSQEANTQT
ncbi:hypothetical protein HGM15179_019201 [Zosterops borbonicus]|uniref:Uncharacterized protein n=1 Tax=Zosterops borbonicus TaxID=364589 RepID=A0A8K1DAZ6_9PASS|nr:hypothetical protein HGM15179_019201 [Zosterops borbonicus]